MQNQEQLEAEKNSSAAIKGQRANSHAKPDTDNTSQKVSSKRRLEPQVCSSRDFVAGFTPPDYLVDGILQRRFLYSFTGKTGSGKTAILLTLAASVGTGRPIGGIGIEPGRVLYLAGENPDDVRMRWIALSQQLGFDIDAIDVHFVPGIFRIPDLVTKIQDKIKTLGGLSCVIVDTGSAYFDGTDENDNKQMGDYARRLRGLVDFAGKPCVVVATHPVKNASDDNLSPRGGGAFLNEMDGNLTARKDAQATEVHWQGKFRGPDFAPIGFLLRTVTHQDLKDSKGRLVPTVVAGHLSEQAREDMAATARTNENQLLAILPTNEGASLADLARALNWLTRDGKPYKMMVKRTAETLAKSKLVTIEAGRIELTPKGQKAAKKEFVTA